jgi:hypothetical protein
MAGLGTAAISANAIAKRSNAAMWWRFDQWVDLPDSGEDNSE